MQFLTETYITEDLKIENVIRGPLFRYDTSVESEGPFQKRHGNNFAEGLVSRVTPIGDSYIIA